VAVTAVQREEVTADTSSSWTLYSSTGSSAPRCQNILHRLQVLLFCTLTTCRVDAAQSSCFRGPAGCCIWRYPLLAAHGFHCCCPASAPAVCTPLASP
jgi:hypothetical protein